MHPKFDPSPILATEIINVLIGVSAGNEGHCWVTQS